MMDEAARRFIAAMRAVAASEMCSGASRIAAATLAARAEELGAVPTSLALSLLARLPDGTAGAGAGAADRRGEHPV